MTGSGLWWLAVLVLVLVPCAAAVEWHSGGRRVPRLDVKVYPRYSVLSASQSVTVQCSVRSLAQRHRSRLRVGFYVRTIYTILYLSLSLSLCVSAAMVTSSTSSHSTAEMSRCRAV